MYQIGEFIVKAANGVCEVKDLVHLDFSDTDSKKLYYHQQSGGDHQTDLRPERRACPAGQKSYGGGWALF